MPAALAHVSLVSYAGSESRTSVAPAVTRTLPSRSTSAVRMRIGASGVGSTVGVAADQREQEA